jgi:hypothetical protein
MFDEVIHDSFDACLSRIAGDFGVSLVDNATHRRLLLRGENDVYPTTESSMKRFLTKDDGKTMRSFYYVSPFVDFEDVYAEYHSDTNGLSEEEGAGFLQHYGFPTDLFDLSPSLETARFFAAYGGNDNPVGVVGTFPYEEVESNFTLTDLSNHPHALRPRRQLAFVARPCTGIIDLKSQRATTLLSARWYRFRKSASDLDFAKARAATIYPSESELKYFFSADVDEFFRSHRLFQKMDSKQRSLVLVKLELIRRQLD